MFFWLSRIKYNYQQLSANKIKVKAWKFVYMAQSNEQ